MIKNIPVPGIEEYEKGKNLSSNRYRKGYSGKNQQKDLEKYPNGYTGQIGIYKKYFDDKNTRLYNQEINRISELNHGGIERYISLFGNIKI